MSDDHIGVKVNGVLYVKLEDARKLREGWDKADERIDKQAAEITRLRAALATARREGEAAGIEWGAGMISAFMKIADKMSDGLGLERDPVKAIEFAIARTLEEAAAIRAAAKEEK
jgi:hypothetical protein